MATKKKAKTKKIFVLNATGEQFDVISETGKYYVCDGTQFRKGSRLGVIREVELPGKKAEAEVQADSVSAEAEPE